MTTENKHWLVTYSSDTWACGDYYCIVVAETAEKAEDIAYPFCEEEMQEQFSTHDPNATADADFEVEYSGPHILCVELLEGIELQEALAGDTEKVNF